MSMRGCSGILWLLSLTWIWIRSVTFTNEQVSNEVLMEVKQKKMDTISLTPPLPASLPLGHPKNLTRIAKKNLQSKWTRDHIFLNLFVRSSVRPSPSSSFGRTLRTVTNESDRSLLTRQTCENPRRNHASFALLATCINTDGNSLQKFIYDRRYQRFSNTRWGLTLRAVGFSNLITAILGFISAMFRLPNLNSPDSQELKGLVGFSIDNATVITRASTVSWLLNLIKSSLGESRVSIGFSNLISTLFGTHFYKIRLSNPITLVPHELELVGFSNDNVTIIAWAFTVSRFLSFIKSFYGQLKDSGSATLPRPFSPPSLKQVA